MRFREQYAIFAACGAHQLAGSHARRAPRGEVRLYPDGHFDIYVAEPFERVVKDRLASLARHVPVGTSSATPVKPRSDDLPRRYCMPPT